MPIEKIPAGDRETWLKLRQKDLTASAAAALFGVHPFISKFELWQLKAGHIGEDPEETPAMQRGRLLEPVAVKLLEEKRPDWTIRHNTGRRQLYWRDTDRRIGATPDVLIDDDGEMGIVQIKSVDQFAFKKKWLADGKMHAPGSWVIEPPLYVTIQAMIEAHLTGAKRAYVTPLVVMHGLEMPIVEVPIHAGVLDRLQAEVADFWDMIESGEEPEPDWSRDKDLLNKLGRKDNGERLDLTGDNRMPALLEERAAAKEIIKVQEKVVEACDEEIVSKIGSHLGVIVPGWKVDRPTVFKKAYEVKASQHRRLDIKKLEEGA